MTKTHGLTVEILPYGTVEKECAANGERIYQLSDLGRLAVELRRGGAAGTASGGEQLSMEGAPQPPPAPAAGNRTVTKGRRRT